LNRCPAWLPSEAFARLESKRSVSSRMSSRKPLCPVWYTWLLPLV
jgi:hypothetical protein